MKRKHITIVVPDDLHVHFRRGGILTDVVPFTSKVFRRALVMPNTNPPILTGSDAESYREEILRASGSVFQPLMTIKLVASTTPKVIDEAKNAGVVAGKLYPEGVTTNSEDGVSLRDLEKCLYPAFERMEEIGMVLCLHGEAPNEPVLMREKLFLHHLKRISVAFPKLRIVLEHVTTSEAVSIVMGLGPNVAATITLHHLLITLDDLLCFKNNGGEYLNPHHYCKPVAKTEEDRLVLVNAALSGNPKFFFGSDTAPHLRGKKECSCGCAGVWTAPVIMPLLAELFDGMGAADRLDAFVSRFGALFYGLPMNEGIMHLSNDADDEVPAEICGIVPFWAGKRLTWRIVRK